MAIEITVRIDGVDVNGSKTPEVNDDRLYVSSYARFFDESCPSWTNDPEMNVMFLKAQQHYANMLLQSRGHLFLNEVYDMLGLPRTKAGQIVGWMYDTESPSGDNCVDFDLHSQHNERFVNGYEKSALLDFNVDGVILEGIL
jgi:hypothetical protein